MISSLAAGLCLALAVDAGAQGKLASRLSLVRGDREPPQGRRKPDAKRLDGLRQAVTNKPKDRTARFNLVRGLMGAGKLKQALAEAKKWRVVDAYNLVVVRLLGDIYTELKQYLAWSA